MEQTPTQERTGRHPLACPKCGCPESYVLRTRAWTQGTVAKPLPAKRRTRQCTSCGKQFHTIEAIEGAEPV